jgi:hypothetical protein
VGGAPPPTRRCIRTSRHPRWTGATTPAEHEARMEVWDETVREQWFERGLAEARALTGGHR